MLLMQVIVFSMPEDNTYLKCMTLLNPVCYEYYFVCEAVSWKGNELGIDQFNLVSVIYVLIKG